MNTKDRTNLIKLAALAGVFLVIVLLPARGSFTTDIKLFIAITVFGIGLFALSVFSSPLMPSLILMFGYTAVSDLSTVMSGWSADSPWIILCVYVILQVAERTGLLNHIAFFILSKTGGTYAGICIGLYAIGFLLSFLGSSVVIAVLAIAAGLVKSLKLGYTRPGIGIMLCAFVSVIDATPFVFDPARLWFYNIAAAGAGITPPEVGYGVWFRNGAVFIVGYLAILAAIILICRPRSGKIDGSEFINEQVKQNGAVSSQEKKAAAIIVLMFAYLFTNNFHDMPMIYGFVAAAVALFLPGLNVGTLEDIKRVNFVYPIFIVACLSIGNVSAQLGVGELIANAVLSAGLESGGETLFLVFVFLLCYSLNFFMTPLSIFAGVMPPLAAIAMGMTGVNDISVIVVTVHIATINIIMPYETANNLVLYSFDTMSLKDYTRAFALRSILSFAVFCLALVYWHAIGLLG